MFFKNLKVYQFTKSVDLTALADALSEDKFRPVGKHDVHSSGFVPPIPTGEMLHHTVGNCTMFCIKQQTRSIPVGALKDAVNERVAQIELEQDRQVFSKERKSLRDDIIMERLPHTLPTSKLTYGYIDAQAGLLVVDSSSHRAAEEFTSALRTAAGSLPIITIPLKTPPSHVMTQWIQKEVPENFDLQTSCVLREQGEEGSVIRCKDQDLSSDEVLNHIESGKTVSALAVSWNDSLTCTLEDDFSIKQLKFSDVVQEKVDDADAETMAEVFDVEFSIMTLELNSFLAELIKAFGGTSEEPVGFAKLDSLAA